METPLDLESLDLNAMRQIVAGLAYQAPAILDQIGLSDAIGEPGLPHAQRKSEFHCGTSTSSTLTMEFFLAISEGDWQLAA
jgi:hypothetical protein